MKKKLIIFYLISYFVSFGSFLSFSESLDFDPFSFNNEDSQPKNIIIKDPNISNFIFDFPLRVWSKYLTKVDGAGCPMYPTCSHFFRTALIKHGFYLAYIMTLARMMKETPDMASYNEYEVILKHGKPRFFDPVENYSTKLTNN